MLYLETIIALALMNYIVDLDAYELHPRDETLFNDFINECWGFVYNCDRDSLLFKVHFCAYMNVNDVLYANCYLDFYH